MTQSEIENKAKIAAINIIDWTCMTGLKRDVIDPNFVSDTITDMEEGKI